MKIMKNLLYLLFIPIFFAGCGKEQTMFPEAEPVGGIISVRSQGELVNESQRIFAIQDDAATRATDASVLTYTFEVWTCDAEPRCVLHKTTTGTLTEALFQIALIPNTYDFLFWADYGPDYYNTSNLRQVTFAETVYMPGSKRDAFACVLKNVSWQGGNGVSATLRRPLAKLTVQNDKPFIGVNPVSVEYRGVPTCYDVLTGVSSALQTVAFPFPNTSSGSTLVGEDFLFVSSQNMALSVTVGSVTKTLDVLALEPNYKTNVTATFE